MNKYPIEDMIRDELSEENQEWIEAKQFEDEEYGWFNSEPRFCIEISNVEQKLLQLQKENDRISVSADRWQNQYSMEMIELKKVNKEMYDKLDQLSKELGFEDCGLDDVEELLARVRGE